MKIRPDSLYAELGRLNLRDEFFAWYAVESPSYAQIGEWLAARGLKSSLAALHRLVNSHYSQWRIAKAVEAADEEVLALPENVDQVTRDRIKGLRLDLAMRDISVDQALALIRLDQDREKTDLAARKIVILEAREAAVKKVVANETLTDAQRIEKLNGIFGL